MHDKSRHRLCTVRQHRLPPIEPAVARFARDGGSAERGCAGRVVGIEHVGRHGLQPTGQNAVGIGEHQAEAHGLETRNSCPATAKRSASEWQHVRVTGPHRPARAFLRGDVRDCIVFEPCHDAGAVTKQAQTEMPSLRPPRTAVREAQCSNHEQS